MLADLHDARGLAELLQLEEQAHADLMRVAELLDRIDLRREREVTTLALIPCRRRLDRLPLGAVLLSTCG